MIWGTVPKELEDFMGRISFKSFRYTPFYTVEYENPNNKEIRKWRGYGLEVRTAEDILDNWANNKSNPYIKKIKGKYFVHTEILFNVQHEFRHQNYSTIEKTRL